MYVLMRLRFQQVSNKVTFPREPRVSTECKQLIMRILAPIKVRISLTEIFNDPWCIVDDTGEEEVCNFQILIYKCDFD